MLTVEVSHCAGFGLGLASPGSSFLLEIKRIVSERQSIHNLQAVSDRTAHDVLCERGGKEEGESFGELVVLVPSSHNVQPSRSISRFQCPIRDGKCLVSRHVVQCLADRVIVIGRLSGLPKEEAQSNKAARPASLECLKHRYNAPVILIGVSVQPQYDQRVGMPVGESVGFEVVL